MPSHLIGSPTILNFFQIPVTGPVELSLTTVPHLLPEEESSASETDAKHLGFVVDLTGYTLHRAASSTSSSDSGVRGEAGKKSSKRKQQKSGESSEKESSDVDNSAGKRRKVSDSLSAKEKAQQKVRDEWKEKQAAKKEKKKKKKDTQEPAQTKSEKKSAPKVCTSMLEGISIVKKSNL